MRIPGKTGTPGYAVEVVVLVLVAVAVLVADPAEQRELGGQGIAQAEIGAGRADVALVGADLLADDVRPGPAEVGEVRPAVDRQPALVTVYVGVLIRVDDHRAEAVATFGVGEVTEPVDQIGARGHGHEERKSAG